MTTANQVTRVRTIGIPVRDQDKALDFYTNVLGLDKTLDVPTGSGHRWIEVSPPGGGTTIALTAAKPGAANSVETRIRLCVGDADAFRRHLLGNGARADEVLRWPGVPPMFAFRDQDGNRLEIVQES